jgi:hypothetical protein
MKGHKMHRKDGGRAHEKQDDDLAGEEKEVKESAAYKKGGKAMKKKHGGKVEGKKAAHRADKYARGGHAHKKHMKDGGMASKVKSAAGMSPASPLSGAGKTAEPKTPEVDKEND